MVAQFSEGTTTVFISSSGNRDHRYGNAEEQIVPAVHKFPVYCEGKMVSKAKNQGIQKKNLLPTSHSTLKRMEGEREFSSARVSGKLMKPESPNKRKGEAQTQNTP